jgi:hypothetical protein
VRPPPPPVTTDPPPHGTPARRKPHPAALVTLLVLVLIALGLGGLLLFAGDDSEPDVGAAGSVTAAPETTAAPEVTTDPPPTEATTSQPTEPRVTDPPATAAPITAAAPPPTTPSTPVTEPPDPNLVALESLNDQVTADTPVVSGLLENWLPQVSAKQFGTEWEGVTYGYPEIWSEHQLLRADYNVILVEGNRYNFENGGAQMVGWYITLLAEPFATAEGALNWCRFAGFDRENCAAKFLSAVAGAEHSLVLQPA